MVADSFCLQNHRCKITARISIFSQVKNIWFSRYFLDESPPYFVDYDSRFKTTSFYYVFKKIVQKYGAIKGFCNYNLGIFQPQNHIKKLRSKSLENQNS